MFTRHLEFSSSHAHRELMSLELMSLSGVLGFRNVESDINPRNLR